MMLITRPSPPISRLSHGSNCAILETEAVPTSAELCLQRQDQGDRGQPAGLQGLRLCSVSPAEVAECFLAHPLDKPNAAKPSCLVHISTPASSKLIIQSQQEHKEDLFSIDLSSRKPGEENASNRLLLTNNKASPTTSSSSAPLKSSLRSSSHQKGRREKQRLHVRGLWDEGRFNFFSILDDKSMIAILSFLPMTDLCKTSMISRRLRHLSSMDEAWLNIDATDFVHQTYQRFEQSESNRTAIAFHTTAALALRLERHSPRTLTIRSIENQVIADNFHPSLKILQEITLTGFSELTDTHVHAMLLSATVADAQRARARPDTTSLRKLVLEDCPRLTNAAVRSIGLYCPNLEELSLQGNRGVTSLLDLKDLWKLAPVSAKSTSSKTISELRQIPTSSKPLSSIFYPMPTTPTRPSASSQPGGLASLFAPPGSSPVRVSMTYPSSMLSIKSTQGSSASGGKLCRVNVAYTPVTADALVQALDECTACSIGSQPLSSCAPLITRRRMLVELESLVMTGSGETWNDSHLELLADCVDVSRLRLLDVSCADSNKGSHAVTADGLESLFLSKKSLSVPGLCLLKLCQLGLVGHHSVRGPQLSALRKATTALQVDL